MQINRLLEIVYILLRQKRVTAKELAARFNVSQRTVYRDIDTLSLAGIPIYTEKGKGGGISLLSEFVLSKSILSEAEQNEILASLHGLSNITTDKTERVLQKLSAVFNKTATDWLEVDFTDWGTRGDDTFGNFKTAILEHRVAEFDYYSTYGEFTHRRVEPLQLLFKSKAWYVHAFCTARNAVRLFKLTRVRNLAVTDTLFARRDLLETRPNPIPSSHQKQDVTFKLKVAPEMAYRIYDEFDEDWVEQLPDGSFLATVTWPEDDWVYGVILSYGDYAEVLEPEHLREIIKDKAQKTVSKYL